jgi:hypothetical protein
MLMFAALAAWLAIPPDRIAHVETEKQVVVVVAPKSCAVQEVRAVVTVRRGEDTDAMEQVQRAKCKPVVFRFPAGGAVVAVEGWEK